MSRSNVRRASCTRAARSPAGTSRRAGHDRGHQPRTSVTTRAPRDRHESPRRRCRARTDLRAAARSRAAVKPRARRRRAKTNSLQPSPPPQVFEALEREAARAAEVEDLLRRRDLERVAADPVDEVVPAAHPARPLVLGPAAHVLERAGRAASAAPTASSSRGPITSSGERDAQRRRKRVVDALDRAPDPAAAALVVVDRDEQAAAGRTAAAPRWRSPATCRRCGAARPTSRRRRTCPSERGSRRPARCLLDDPALVAADVAAPQLRACRRRCAGRSRTSARAPRRAARAASENRPLPEPTSRNVQAVEVARCRASRAASAPPRRSARRRARRGSALQFSPNSKRSPRGDLGREFRARHQRTGVGRRTRIRQPAGGIPECRLRRGVGEDRRADRQRRPPHGAGGEGVRVGAAGDEQRRQRDQQRHQHQQAQARQDRGRRARRSARTRTRSRRAPIRRRRTPRAPPGRRVRVPPATWASECSPNT